MKKLQHALLSSALVLGSFQAVAVPFSGTDARSLAMGGTGVASGSVANASTFNPALLSAYREDEDFNLSFAFGVIARDEQGMLDSLDAFQNGPDYVAQLGTNTTAYQDSITAAILADPALALDIVALQADPLVSTASGNLNTTADDLATSLNDLANKPIDLGATIGVNVTIPGKTLGISVFANSRILGSGYITDIEQDTAILTTFISDLTNPADLAAMQAISDPFAGTSLQSALVINGAAVTEVGLALSTKIAGIAIGVTPKNVQIDAIEFRQGIETADSDTALDNTGESFADVNFDVGVAMDLGAFKLGAVAKNMLSQEYVLASGNSVVLDPQLRAGIAFDAGWATLTMDQDLTVNKGIFNTGNPLIDDKLETQYTAVGVELDLALVSIRAGMRTDATGNSPDVLTAGFGLHLLVSFDLAVAASDNGAEAIFQAGLRW